MTLFIRAATNPAADLVRGYSYSMGEFGNEDEAHAGLSSYSLDELTLDGALEQLHDRMQIVGAWTDNATGEAVDAFVCVLRGRSVGVGPEGEALCAPAELVCAVNTREVASVEEMAERVDALVRAAGYEP